ncbi:Ig-like domain-containing protein, partial [Schleiferiaceae bacterium]|nr:Ig-like domain-containing protein [Schleiferiaceae bacterium]
MSRLFRSLVKKIKPLVFFFFYFIGLSFHSSAQSCPSIKRNNGNNAAHTDYALSVMNTAFTNVPSSAKEGTITVDFGSSMSASAVPVIEGVYIGGSRLNVDFGPPSEINNVGPKYNVEYCFYGSNLPPAKSFTVRFLNPSDSSVWSECTFPKLSGSDANTINVSSDIADNAVCAGESITWTATATAANGQSLSYQWYKDSSVLSGKTNASLTVSNFGSSDAGTYYCIVEEFKKNTINWSFQTPAGTLSLSNCANLEITRIQSPDEISISGSNDLSVAFDVEFNQDVNTPATTDFSAILDLSSSRTISSISSFGGSSKRYIVVVDILDEDEGQLALAVASSNSISSSSGSLNLSSTTPTITNNNSFSIGADGVAPAVESAVAGGDRNGDGVPDRNQKNVSTFPWRSESKFNQGAAASTNDFVTLSIGDVSNSSSTNLDKNLKISTLGVIGISDSYFSGVSFPSTATIGGTSQNVNAIYDPIFFKIEANGNSFSARDVDNTRAGTQIRLYFDMPDGGQNFDTYMKWNGVDEQWYEFKADGNLATYDDGAEFIDSDGDGDYDRVVLTITEGDKLGGDADGSADNIIIDPGTIVSTSGLNYTGALSFNILEGNTDVAMLTTTGANSYTLQTPTGYDHGLFTLNSTNGTLSFTNAPDYENPQDVFGTAGDNIYMVQVLISDGSNSTVIDVEVNVLDRYEFGQNNCPTLINKNPGGQLNNSWSYASSFTGITTTVNATGYIEFEFGDIPAQEGLPKIVAAFVDGVRDNLVEFDDPKVYVGSKSADQYANSGLTRYVWHAQPSNNFSSANTFQLLFDNGGLLNINDLNSACGYSSASGTPLNSISFTEGYVSSNSECEGSNISFDITSATATNGGTITYQWQKLNTTTGVFDDLSGKTSASLSIASVVSSDAGTYRCSIKEIDGSSATIMAALSTEAQLSVTAGPTINFASLTLCAGSTSNLSVTSNNTTGDSWGSSDPTVATVNSSGQVTGVNAGTATITYTDGDGCSTTSSITVPASPSAVLDDNTPSVCSTSATYELDLSSIIGSPDEYQIDYSSGLLTDVGLTSFTGSTLTLNVPTSASGSYAATLYLKNTSSNCESSAIPFTLNIDALPNDGLAVSDATICDGSSANITVGSSENGYSYQLRNNADDSNEGAAINGNGGDITFNVSPNSTTSYNFLVTNGNCSVELTDISTVTIDALSVGGTLDNDGSGTGAAGATVVAGANSTTIYLSGHTGSVVRWESSSDNTFSTVTQIANTANTYTATNVNATTYYRALIQNGSCNPDYSTTFTLSTLSQPTVTFASTTPSACEGDAGTLTISSKSAGADQYRIDWDASAELAGFNDVGLTLIPVTNTISLAANNTATSYNATVYVKNSITGLESTGASITYTVNATPTITGTTLVCLGSSATLTGSGTPAGVDPWISANTSVATINSSGVITPVGSGTSVITYTDNNGCSTTTTVTVNALPTTTITSSDVDNTICDGESITLTSDQSGFGYTYKWFKDGSVIPGETSSSYLATVSGSYTVEVTNSSTGCIATTPGANAIAVVENSNPVIALSSSTNVACFGESTGAINISVSGGDGNFTFAWSDGASYSATSEDISNVFPGAYSVTVTDGNSCSANTSYNITQPASALSATTSSTNVSSSGGSDGSATVTPSGGTAGYTYLWSDGQTNATATNLTAGNYSVVIKDANLCSITKNFTVTEPSSLSATATAINNVSCNNGSDGSASVSVTGGTSPYTYSWNTSPIQTNSTATNLAAGTYTVTITDFTNVVTTANVTISEPSALSLSITATDVSCVDDVTGALDATVTGGSPNYTFAWSNSSSSEDQTGLGTGTYSLTVTDDNGCQISSSATISVLDNIAPTVTTQDITVQMDALGSATITAAMINDGSTDNCAISSLSLDITSFDCDDLGPNTVVLNVTDNNGNSATGTATVTVEDKIDPTITAPAAVTVNVDAGACSTAL